MTLFRKGSSGGGTSWTSDNYSVWTSSSEDGTGDEVGYLRFTCRGFVVDAECDKQATVGRSVCF